MIIDSSSIPELIALDKSKIALKTFISNNEKTVKGKAEKPSVMPLFIAHTIVSHSGNIIPDHHIPASSDEFQVTSMRTKSRFQNFQMHIRV